VSDSDLRQALLGTWRLISYQAVDVDGTVATPFGDNPQGYLVYTPDGHVLAQAATRAQRVWPPRPDLLDLPLPQRLAEQGLVGYCGTYEVRDSQVIHHREFGLEPSLDGTAQTRAVTLDGDQLILGTPDGSHFTWQRVH
jgi:hypothetical protein